MNAPPRVNPFVGVPESTLRFVLLALATVASATYAWQYIHQVLHGRAVVAALGICNGLSQDAPDPPFRNAYARCWAERIALPLGQSITLGVVLTVVIVLVCFAVAPVVLRRIRRLTPLPLEGSDALRSDLAGLARELNVTAPPVLVDPSPTSSPRMMAGGFRVPALVVGSGLLAAVRSRAEGVRAVLAHELAHVRNADVRLAELAVAAWWTLTLAVLTPYVISALAGGYPGSVLVVVLKLMAILLLARLLRNALLRAREVDADIRASTVAAVRAPLETLLATTGRSRAALWSSHPSGSDRWQRVVDPTLVLRTSGPDLLALGATAYFLIPGVSFWLTQYAYGRPVSTVVMSAVSWLVGGILGAGLWALAWRSAVAERFTGLRQPDGLRSAAWLTAGLLLGAFLVPVPRPTLGLFNVHSPVQWLTMGVAVFLGCLLVTGVARSTARRLVRRAGLRRPAGILTGLGLVIVSGLAALVLHVERVFVLYSSEGFGLGNTLFGTTFTVLLSPSTYVLLLLTVAGLVASALVRPGPADAVPEWMVLRDTDRQAMPAADVSPPRPPG